MSARYGARQVTAGTLRARITRDGEVTVYERNTWSVEGPKWARLAWFWLFADFEAWARGAHSVRDAPELGAAARAVRDEMIEAARAAREASA